MKISKLLAFIIAAILAAVIIYFMTIAYLTRKNAYITPNTYIPFKESTTQTDNNVKTDSAKVPKYPNIQMISYDFGEHFTAVYPFFYASKADDQPFTQNTLDNLSQAVESFVIKNRNQSPKSIVSLKYLAWEMADEHLLSVIFEKKEIIDDKPTSTIVSLHYDSQTKRSFELSDVFKPGIEKKISELTQGTLPRIENFSNFSLGESTVRFYLAPGLTDGTSGETTNKSILYNELKDWFQDDFKILYEEQYSYPMQ